MSLQSWYQSSVLSTEGWTYEKLIPLLDLAGRYKQCIQQKTDISIKTPSSCLTLFYEPSTRTRLSFECAANKLGIKFITVANAGNDSSTFKGETLEDTGKILSAYADVIVMRHPEIGSAQRLALSASVPVINAGDGTGEHPTQALLDIFTIREAFGRVDGLHIGFCGDLKNGRTVHSLLRLLVGLECRITAISPEELAFPPQIIQKISGASNWLSVEPDLKMILPELDILYMTRVQKERFEDPQLYEKVKKYYSLTQADLVNASDHLKIFHPLPRVDEVDTDIDSDKRAHYFTQAANGVPVRMALLSAVLGLQNSITF